MKRVPMLMLLIMAFVSFATITFADNSPPGVEISISYELPEGIELNIESQVAREWQAIEMTKEGRIAVYDCDLKCWPGVDESIKENSNNIAGINFVYDDALCRTIDLSLNTNNSLTIKDKFNNQHRLFVDKNEVLSLFYNSKGERFSARNEIT